MKKHIMALLAGASAAVSANATITVNVISGGYAASAANPNLITFDGSNPLNGFTLSGSGYTYGGNGSVRPIGDSTNYLSVSSGTAKFASSKTYTNLQFLWATPDTYNYVDLYNGSTLLGTISTANFSISGDQLVSITSTQSFNAVAFRSFTNCCFEVDNISFQNPAAVPEPASWAMFIGGFGAIGGALRRHRRPVSVFP